jgi:hypothetical protein
MLDKELRSTLKLSNIRCHSILNLWVSLLLAESVKIGIHKIVFFLWFCMGVRLSLSH